jgi:arabinoxylan arabinofuranohydrolase
MNDRLLKQGRRLILAGCESTADAKGTTGTNEKGKPMRNKSFSAGVFLTITHFIFIAACLADNPIIQTNYTADPAPLVYKDTVFLYTSHDEDNAQGFVMNNWMLYTSTDLVNWRDHGIIASLKNFSWENGSAWAPHCVFRNGKYYLYCPLNKKGGNISIGVLVSDSPYGPFTDPLNAPLITGSSATIQGANDYDPGVLIDDDGKAYIYWGGNGPCLWAELKQDMISLAGPVQRATINGATGEASYTEGPWPFKRDNIYYLSWASRCCPEGIGYATSDKPSGPWTCKGTIMRPNARSSGNHPGIMEFKGKWYVFGFTYELLFTRIPYSTSKPERRSICLAEMTYNADGTIKEVPWFGSPAPLPGVPQVDTLNPYETIQAETICWSFGVRTKTCNEGGLQVDSIHNNDFIKVKGVDFGSGAKSFEARVASATSGGGIELRLDTITGPLVGTCAVTGTGSATTWATKSCDITNATGMHDLYLKFTGGSGLLFAFNWWKFTALNNAIGAVGKNQIKHGNEVKVTVIPGKSQTLRLDFSHPVPKGSVHVSLFTLSGRLVLTVFAGNVSSRNLKVPLTHMKILPGAYCLKIASDNTVVMMKIITLK